MPLVHHELCFGCGRTNLFGLMLELQSAGPDEVRGRCFVKQDHQGAERGAAHEGVLAAALSEAMALASGPDARAARIEVNLVSPAPVGAFLEIVAKANGTRAIATATQEGLVIARAVGSYAR
jgi:acyl-coenzyme A thioesterase PaaI-like protein